MPRIPTGVAAAILLVAAHVSAPLVSARAEQSTATAGSESHGLGLQLLADELTAPIDLVSPPDSSGRRFVTDQAGLIHVLAAGGKKLAAPFLDLRDRLVALTQSFEERGLLGFALHPGFAENGRVFVTYSAPLRTAAPAGWNHTRRVSEFTVSARDADQADPKSERVLLELDWPSRKHNGGGQEVLFEAFDVPKTMTGWDRFAQDTSSLYGKILRLDVDRGYPGYATPPLNPLAGVGGRPEIYAWGFRNPYRLSFDRGALFVTAVGETLWESVYLVDKPGNYGWPIREGTHCFDRLRPKTPPRTCPTTGPHGEPLIDPVIEYPNMSVERDGVEVGRRGIGSAVVGGHVYRGEALTGLRGRYVFGDWSREFAKPSGQIFVASPPAEWGELWRWQKVLDVPGRVLSLGRDKDGELYVLTNDELGPFGQTGKVYKLVRRSE